MKPGTSLDRPQKARRTKALNASTGADRRRVAAKAIVGDALNRRQAAHGPAGPLPPAFKEISRPGC